MPTNVFDLYAEINLKTDNYKDQLNEAKRESESTADSLSARAVAIGAVMANVAEKAGEALVNLAKTGVAYNAQIETYTVALATALGSEAEAASAIENIKKDAAATPYSVDGLIKANQLLIAAGESAADSRATIMALTDAISATGGGNEELTRMAQNLQQIRNVGKATSMDIKQFQMAGIEVYGLIADYTGKSIAEVQELDITYELLSGALQNAAAEGGKFYQANLKQSQTLNGQISTLKDNVQQKLGEAFQAVSNTIRDNVLPVANKFVESIDVAKVGESLKKLVPVIGTIGAALAAQKVGSTIAVWVAAFQTAQVQVALLAMETGAAGVAQAALNGELTIGETIVALLTGKITLATAAQAAWNTATAAFPYAIIVGAIAAVGFAVKNVSDAYKNAKIDVEALKASLAGSTPPETIARVGELAAEYNKLSDQLISTKSELDNLRAAGIDDATDREYQAKINALNEQMKGLKRTISELTDTAAEVPDAIGDSVDGLAEQTAELDKQWEDLTKRYVDTYEDISKKVDKWFGLFDEAKVNVKTSIDDMMSAMQSQINFNQSYSANLEKIRSYDLPQVAAAFKGMGAEGSAYAAELVAAVEAAGGATSEAGQKIISDFNALSEGVASSKKALSASLSNVTGEFDSVFADMIATTEQAVADMNQADAAGASGAATVQAYIAAIAAGSGPAYSAAAAVASAAAAGLGGTPTRRRGAGAGGPVAVPLAVGSDYIPYDDYPALLHKGEMVVPAKISADLRDFLGAGKQPSGSSGGGGMGEVISLLRQILAKPSDTYLNGERVSEILAPSTNRALGNIDALGGRGLSMA